MINENFKIILDYFKTHRTGDHTKFGEIIYPPEVINAFKNENKHLLAEIRSREGQFFNYLNVYSVATGWPNINKLYVDIPKLSCLFPSRTIISTPVAFREDIGIIGIRFEYEPVFMELYNNNKDLINQNIIKLFFMYDFKDFDLDDSDNHELKIPTVLYNSRTKSNVLNEIQMRLPWLYNARYQDYLEIIDKYKVEFEIYTNHIDKISRIASNQDCLTDTFVNEFKDAMLDIRISLEKKQRELKMKGIETIVGFIFTAIPLILPELFKEISPELLSGILGATTLRGELIPMIKNINELMTNKRDDPYWILWEWNKKYM